MRYATDHADVRDKLRCGVVASSMEAVSSRTTATVTRGNSEGTKKDGLSIFHFLLQSTNCSESASSGVNNWTLSLSSTLSPPSPITMDCFGSSSDEEDADVDVKRDPSCGVFSFHPNTEQSLITHVKNSTTLTSSSAYASDVQVNSASDVLQAVDKFCTSRHWMMHVGPEKGEILTGALREAMDAKLASRTSDMSTPFVAVELGSYCCYSSILMAREFYKQQYAKLNSHLFTVEINPEYAKVAAEMARLSGLDGKITVHEISYNGHDTDVDTVVQDALIQFNSKEQGADSPKIDFLFIDHDKDMYKADLIKLESAGLVRQGTKVVADNVLFAQIDDYIEYVQKRKEEGTVNTLTIPCQVEYSNEDEGDSSVDVGVKESYVDGVEITDYLVDP